MAALASQAAPGVQNSDKLIRWRSLLRTSGTHIQEGGQGAVLRIHDAVTGRDIAAKIISPEQAAAARNETRALKRLRNGHAHIVHIDGVLRSRDDTVIIFSECAEMDMHDALGFRPARSMGEHASAREWMLQVAHALAHCHAQGVAHRDVKPENVLLFPTGSAPKGSQGLGPALRASGLADAPPQHDALRHGFMAKLCDFGSASTAALPAPVATGRPQTGWAACGSVRYAPPEISRLIALNRNPEGSEGLWSQDTYDWQGIVDAGYDACAADVWCFGMLVYTACTGLAPFSRAAISSTRFRAFLLATSPHSKQDELFNPSCSLWGQGVGVWRWPRGISPALKHLLAACLALDPAARPSMAALLRHPWFSKPDWCPPGHTPPPTSRLFVPSAGVGTRSASPMPRGEEDARSVASDSDGPMSTASGLSREGALAPAPSHVDLHTRTAAIGGGERGLSHASAASLPSLPSEGSGSGIFAAAAAGARSVGSEVSTPSSGSVDVGDEERGDSGGDPVPPPAPAGTAAPRRSGGRVVASPSHALALESPKGGHEATRLHHHTPDTPASAEVGSVEAVEGGADDSGLLAAIHSGAAFGFAQGHHAALPVDAGHAPAPAPPSTPSRLHHSAALASMGFVAPSQMASPGHTPSAVQAPHLPGVSTAGVTATPQEGDVDEGLEELLGGSSGFGFSS